MQNNVSEMLNKIFKSIVIILTTLSNQIWIFVGMYIMAIFYDNGYVLTNDFLLIIYLIIIVSLLSFLWFKIMKRFVKKHFKKDITRYEYALYFILTIIFLPHIFTDDTLSFMSKDGMIGEFIMACAYSIVCVISFILVKIIKKIANKIKKSNQ